MVSLEDLTRHAQTTKRLILEQLVKDKHLTQEEADEWASTRAIICSSKTLNLWDMVFNKPPSRKEEKTDKNKIYYDIVKK